MTKTKTNSPASTRVAIARDVIKQLNSKKLRVTTDQGNFFTTKVKTPNPDIQEIVKNSKFCTVCAVGALFACTVQKHNSLEINYSTDGDYDYQELRLHYGFGTHEKTFFYLNQYFTKAQLASIEYCYELGNGATDYEDINEYLNKGEINELVRFGKSFTSKKARLIAIMKNIIKNNGDFKL
jgi:hypothetical protein